MLWRQSCNLTEKVVLSAMEAGFMSDLMGRAVMKDTIKVTDLYVCFLGVLILQMPQRKLWSQSQDRALRRLKEEQGIHKWSIISRRMGELGLPGRTGKQCRQRYHNHLDGTIMAVDWTQEEEETLFRLHGEVGNKWSLMAQQLPGRSDNCVKNHFYSRLRKGVRRLNKLIADKLHQDYREVKVDFLYKILEISESKFKSNCKHDEDLIEKCTDIKNDIYLLEDAEEVTGDSLQQVAGLIGQINRLECKLRRGVREKQKKESESSGSGSEKTVLSEVVKEEDSGQPFYRVFKRVCDQIIRSTD